MQGMMKKLFTASKVKTIEKDGVKLHRFLATDESVDRMGDIIRFDGWDISNFEKNAVILWVHSHLDPPIGKGTIVRDTENKAHFVDVEFASRESPFADSIERLTEAGFINAVSVGFLPKSGGIDAREDDDGNFIGYEFTKQELLEVSIVPVPAHQDALAVLDNDARELVTQKGLFVKAGGDEDWMMTCDTVKKIAGGVALLRADMRKNTEAAQESVKLHSLLTERFMAHLEKFGSSVTKLQKSMQMVGEAISDSESDVDPSGDKPVEGTEEFSEEQLSAFDDIGKTLDEALVGLTVDSGGND